MRERMDRTVQNIKSLIESDTEPPGLNAPGAVTRGQARRRFEALAGEAGSGRAQSDQHLDFLPGVIVRRCASLSMVLPPTETLAMRT